MVSKARELFPDPESPDITMSLSLGSSKSMFFKLCSLAPLMMSLSIIKRITKKNEKAKETI
jgi:hypothetical protein